MYDEKWSSREKQIAHQVFDGALADELASTLADFKRRAAALTEPEQMWELERFLRDRGREIGSKYDYRYSQLIYVFGRLLHEGRIREEQLAGLGEEKIGGIRRMAELFGSWKPD